jgi:hypothetical protein
VAYKEWDNDEVEGLLNNLVDMISGVARIDQSIQNQSPDEFLSLVEDLSEVDTDAQQHRQNIDSVQDEEKRNQVGEAMDQRQQQTQSQSQSQQQPYSGGGPPDEEFGPGSS